MKLTLLLCFFAIIALVLSQTMDERCTREEKPGTTEVNYVCPECAANHRRGAAGEVCENCELLDCVQECDAGFTRKSEYGCCIDPANDCVEEKETTPVECFAPCEREKVCPDGQIAYTKEGECCPEHCKPTDDLDCSNVMCPAVYIDCPDGYEPGYPKDGCCKTECVPTIDVCSFKDCPARVCDPTFEITVTSPEGCCEVCKRKCSTVLCPEFRCEGTATPVRREGGDCCDYTCSTEPVCEEKMCDEPGQEKLERAGKCPECILVDTSVCPEVCPAVLCSSDTEQYIKEGECCPVCRVRNEVDCSLVRCAQPVCETNESPVIPAGACCGICRENRGVRVERDRTDEEIREDTDSRDEYEREMIELIRRFAESRGVTIDIDEFVIIVEEADGRKVAHVSFSTSEYDTDFRNFVEEDTTSTYEVNQINNEETSSGVAVASVVATVAFVALF